MPSRTLLAFVWAAGVPLHLLHRPCALNLPIADAFSPAVIRPRASSQRPPTRTCGASPVVLAALAATEGSKTPDEDTEKLDVAIVGGGPAGLATALALIRGAPEAAAGGSIAVFESDDFMPKGASIVVSKPGWDALRCIDGDVHKKARRNGSPVSALFFKDFSGRHYLPPPVQWITWALYPVLRLAGIGIVRSTGWHALRNELKEGAKTAGAKAGYGEGSLIRQNKRLVAIETGSHDSLLTFDDGTKVRASLVLACDGTFSTVRRCLDELHGKPRDASPPFLIDEGKTVWRGTAPNIESNGKATFYVASPRGSGDGKVGTGATFPPGKTTPGTSVAIILPSVPGRASGPDDAKARLKTALKALEEPLDGEIMRAINDIEHMLEHRLHTRDFRAYPSLESGCARIAFLGDASHPLRPTGEGVAIALEDAWTIGHLAKRAEKKKKREKEQGGIDQEKSGAGGVFTPDLLREFVEKRQDRVVAVGNAIRDFAEEFYDDGGALSDRNKSSGKVQTKKTSVDKAMKAHLIYFGTSVVQCDGSKRLARADRADKINVVAMI